jgi:hypothetical protein
MLRAELWSQNLYTLVNEFLPAEVAHLDLVNRTDVAVHIDNRTIGLTFRKGLAPRELLPLEIEDAEWWGPIIRRNHARSLRWSTFSR